MPTPIYIWDFETGTTEGWSLGPKVTLDGGSAIQGTYSLKYYYYSTTSATVNELLASISGIDLSTATRPLIVFAFRDTSGGAGYPNDPGNIGVRVKDAADNLLLDVTVTVMYRVNNQYKIAAVDLSAVAGQSNLKIELWELGYMNRGADTYIQRTHYVDVIAIFDGCDYEYNVGIIARQNEDKTLTINIPTADQPLPGGVTALGVCLATPPWFGSETSDIRAVTATTDIGSLAIDSSQRNIGHANRGTQSPSPTYFQKIDHRSYITTLSAYYAFDEKVIVVFLIGWSYACLYAFNIKYTINGITPPFATALHTTTYGTTVSGQKDYGIKIHATSLDIAMNVKYICGDHTLMNTGTLEFEVWNTEFITLYGSGSVDLTTGSDLTSAYATDIPVDTNLVLRFKWSLNAKARVILRVSPIFRVE